MGLDMYLTASNSYFDSEIFGSDRRESYGNVIQAVNGEGFIGGDNFTNYAEVSLSVAYWRKAHQIHQWFVDNVQNGEDNCAKYYVSRDKLEELLATCEEVVTKRNPEEKLPITDSYFGFAGYNEWYWEQVNDTVRQVKRILDSVPENWEFEYQASW
jgi:hypothetical protein